MGNEQDKVFLTIQQLFDLLLVASAFIAAYFIKKYLLPWGLVGVSIGPNYYVVLALALGGFTVVSHFLGYCQPLRELTADRIFVRTVKVVLFSSCFLTLALYFLKITNVSRFMMALFLLLAIVFLTAGKLALLFLNTQFRQQKGYQDRLLIIGSRERAKDAIRLIKGQPHAEIALLGCLDTDPGRVGEMVLGDVEIIAATAEFEHILQTDTVDEAIFAMPFRKLVNVAQMVAFAETVGVKVRIMPDWQLEKIMYRPEVGQVLFENFMGVPSITLSSAPAMSSELLIKSVIDYLGAFLGMIVLSPLLAVLALLVKGTSPGPVFFKQERVGVNGRLFQVFKFRTMGMNAEAGRDELLADNEMDGPVFKIKHDPRVTWLGRFLRASSLDELPQLFNVLRGEMSLVGPRPPLQSEVQQYKPWQRRRLSMKPGITCIWQVSGRNSISFDEWMRLDLKYIDNWSLWLDCKLLLLTVRAVVMGTGH